jgi:hypothetical protein
MPLRVIIGLVGWVTYSYESEVATGSKKLSSKETMRIRLLE